MNKIYVIGGGTTSKINPQLSLSAQDDGKMSVEIYEYLENLKQKSNSKGSEYEIVHITTKMAGGPDSIETYEDVKAFINNISNREDTKGIIMSASILNYKPRIVKKMKDDHMHTLNEVSLWVPTDKLLEESAFDKFSDSSFSGHHAIEIEPTESIIQNVRKNRKDIFLVSFKTVSDEKYDASYKIGLDSLTKNKSSLVFMNDAVRNHNMIVTPDEFIHKFKNQSDAVRELCHMIWSRVGQTFNKTNVKSRDRAKLSELEGNIPENFLPVINHLISEGAYKTIEVVEKKKKGPKKFKQISTGNFGCKVTGKKGFYRISSGRKSNLNEVNENGVIKIISEEGKLITVSGGKPSAGSNVHKAVFDKLKNEVDSIIHFHCPIRKGVEMHNDVYQSPYQSGSIESAENISNNMRSDFRYPGIYSVYVQGHGSVIAFSKDVDKDVVISFINEYCDLSKKEDGLDYKKVKKVENL